MKYNISLFLLLCSVILNGQTPQNMDAVGEFNLPGGINYAGIATFSGDMYIATHPSLPIREGRLQEGTLLTFTANTTNTGASKLMLTNGEKSSSAFPVYKHKTEELSSMDISAGRLTMVLFSKNSFHLIIKNSELSDFLTNCNGLWVSTEGSDDFCGDCKRKCAPGETCFDGRCIAKCQGNESLCGNYCKNLSTDKNNCGDCGLQCPPGTICNNGRCDSFCPPELKKCADTCADLKVDENNCGSCGNACPPGFVCDNGQCQISCPADFTNCNFDCVELNSDPNNCGTCGLQCPEGFDCTEGKCIPVCPTASKLCKGVCIDIATDKNNCGDCGRSCPPGQICQGGKCQ